MATKRSVPSMAESALLRYLQQIFKIKGIEGCGDAYTAIDFIRGSDNAYVPEGLDAECALIYERKNVRGALWSLTPSKDLAMTALEVGDDEGRGYFLISDENLSGADSLFLCAVSINDCQSDAQADITYVINSWSRHGCPRITIGGYHDKKHGGSVHIIAAQLASLV